MGQSAPRLPHVIRPCAVCGFGGPEAAWACVRPWPCACCAGTHLLCPNCARDWGGSWAWSSAETRESLPPLPRCPFSAEARTARALMWGEG